MNAEDGLSLVLPFLLLIFAGAFLLVARYGSLAARLWGISYLVLGSAHLSPVVLASAGVVIQALVADALFIAGFCLFGEALVARFGKPLKPRSMLVFFLLAYGAAVYAVVVQGSLRFELLFCDLGSALPLAFAMTRVWTSVRRPIEQALFWLTGLVAADTVVRLIVFLFVLPVEAGPENYAGSDYVFFMALAASLLGLLFALTALAAVSLDVVAGYRDAAERDPLTGLLNRRGFERSVQGLVVGALPSGAVVACDIDRFKGVNDTFGHAAGDRVIVGLADLLRTSLPSDAIAARFGGEEFVVFLPRHTNHAAGAWTDSVRRTLAGRDWSTEGISRRITASFGIARPAAEDRSLANAMARADQCLYAAKAAGRNCTMRDDVGHRQPDGWPLVRVA